MADRILLVEDEADIRLTVQLALEMAGYEVVVAPSAEQALEVIGDVAPAAILLDITLPGMDGWEFLQRLEDDGRLIEVGVVVVSAHVSEEVSRRAEAFGARYLTKPFDIMALRSTLSQVLGSGA